MVFLSFDCINYYMPPIEYHQVQTNQLAILNQQEQQDKMPSCSQSTSSSSKYLNPAAKPGRKYFQHLMPVRALHPTPAHTTWPCPSSEVAARQAKRCFLPLNNEPPVRKKQGHCRMH